MVIIRRSREQAEAHPRGSIVQGIETEPTSTSKPTRASRGHSEKRALFDFQRTRLHRALSGWKKRTGNLASVGVGSQLRKQEGLIPCSARQYTGAAPDCQPARPTAPNSLETRRLPDHPSAAQRAMSGAEAPLARISAHSDDDHDRWIRAVSRSFHFRRSLTANPMGASAAGPSAMRSRARGARRDDSLLREHAQPFGRHSCGSQRILGSDEVRAASLPKTECV